MIDPGWMALRSLPDDIEALIRMGDLAAADALLTPLEERARASTGPGPWPWPGAAARC